MEMLYLLIRVVIKWVYKFVKIHQTLHLKCMYFNVSYMLINFI